jgi:hypothetical protein
MMKETSNLIACCGLDCSKCEGYIATQENDDNKRAEVAKKWSAMHGGDIKSEDINCNGCRSDGLKFSYCDTCDIRKCCMEKGVQNCAGCDMYVCERMENFFKMAPDARSALERLRK